MQFKIEVQIFASLNVRRCESVHHQLFVLISKVIKFGMIIFHPEMTTRSAIFGYLLLSSECPHYVLIIHKSFMNDD